MTTTSAESSVAVVTSHLTTGAAAATPSMHLVQKVLWCAAGCIIRCFGITMLRHR